MNPLSGLTKLVEHWLTKNIRKKYTPLCDFQRIRHELKTCDVLLIEGRSRVAGVISYITQSNWTHSALYIGRLYDVEDTELRKIIKQYYKGAEEEQLIIESELGAGTVIRPLTFYKNEHIRICRPKNLAYSDGQQMLAYTITQLGKSYYKRQIFDLMRFFLPYKALPPRFGSTLFNLKAGYATKTVCSSMIAEAFCFVQFPILPLVKVIKENNVVKLYHRNPKICTPKDFDYSPYFQIIKYPFLDCSHHESYRLLPWSGDNQLDSTENSMYMTQDKLDTLHHINKNFTDTKKSSQNKHKAI